jgi:uncharacterized protein
LAEGRLVYEAAWAQGKLNGIERRLSPTTGKPISELTYAAGQLEGVEKQWYPAGPQRSLVTWSKGKRNGQEVFWDESSRKLHELGWQDDKKHGLEREWYSDGSPLQETQWEAGKRQGPHKEWFPGGAKKLECQYEKDAFQGAYTAWNEAGEVRSQGEYKDDHPWGGQFVEPGSLPTQHFIMRYRDGLAVDGILFEEGRPKTGKVVEYYIRGEGEQTMPTDGGSRMREYFFVDGRREGSETRWHPNGQVQMQLTWKQNKPDGELKEFFETGKLKRMTTFKMGAKDGREIHWNRDGGVVCDGIYREGQPWEGTVATDDHLKQTIFVSKITVYHHNILGPEPTFSMEDDSAVQTIKSYRAGKRLD